MRILLLMPDGHIHKVKVGAYERSMREAPLTLTLLASLAPEHLDIAFTLIDESVDRVPSGQRFDLVAISLITGTSVRGYRWAAYFRKKGMPVVIGGVHATLLPEEAARHADYVVAGPGERLWPRFLQDFALGCARKMYRESCADQGLIRDWPVAKRHLQRSSRYNMPYTISATRGCRHACSFCTVPSIWEGYTTRPIASVIDEIRLCSGKYLAFNDVSLVDDTEYAKALFHAMIPLKKLWGGLATVKIGQDPELIELMARSGCRYLLIGFESITQNALREVKKGFNREQRYLELMRLLHSYKISVQGCFIFGFDQDNLDVFESTVEQVKELQIDIPRYAVLTPYPGTPLYRRLNDQGRILTYDWSNYDTMHVVFQPQQMSPEQLYDGFKWAYRETFKLKSIFTRVKDPHFSSLINLVGNLTYRRFVNRLYSHPRYAQPFANLEATGKDIPEPVTG